MPASTNTCVSVACQLLEHVLAHLADGLDVAGGLERDGGDRTAALVVGVAEALGVDHEVAVDRGREVGGVARPLDGAADALAGTGQRLDADLLLAAGEVVVHGPERGIALGDNLFDPGGRIPLTTHQPDGGVEDPVAGVAGVERPWSREKD